MAGPLDLTPCRLQVEHPVHGPLDHRPQLLEEAAIVTPALTTIRQPLAEMGRIAVSLLMRLLENQRLEALHVELGTRLVVRDSTAPPRR